eukprot:gene25888-biopygen6039
MPTRQNASEVPDFLHMNNPQPPAGYTPPPKGRLRGLRGGPRRGPPADPRGALIGGPHGLRLTCAGPAPRVTGGACGLPPAGDLDDHAGSVRGPSSPWRGRAAGLRARPAARAGSGSGPSLPWRGRAAGLRAAAALQ